MNQLQFLYALDFLFKENKATPITRYTMGYRKALYDVLEVYKLTKKL